MKPSPFIRDDEIFLRMNLAERVQHILLIISFAALMLTGIPLLFLDTELVRRLLASDQVAGIRALLHRSAAVLLILDLLWLALYSAFTRRGRANLRALRPGKQDVLEALQAFGFRLGIGRWLLRRGIGKAFFARHPFWLFAGEPEYGRYNFIEKFEFWAVIWGSGVMILSGFFMWNVPLSLRLFPLWVHNVFVIVHGYEAVLAFLAVIIWHMYNVHLNPEVFPMSRIWIDGKITGHELRRLHPREYREIHEARSSH